MTESLSTEQIVTMDLLRVVAPDEEFSARLLGDGSLQIFHPDDASRVLITIASATYDDLVARGALIPATVLFTDVDDDSRPIAFRLR